MNAKTRAAIDTYFNARLDGQKVRCPEGLHNAIYSLPFSERSLWSMRVHAANLRREAEANIALTAAAQPTN